MKDINRAMLMKLEWSIVEKKVSWANYMQAKYFNSSGDIISYYKKSSMWRGIKEAYLEVKKCSKWSIATGEKINIWTVNWALDTPLSDHMIGGDTLGTHMQHVSDLIENGYWQTDNNTARLLQSAGVDFTKLFVNISGKDTCFYTPNIHRNFSVKVAHKVAALRSKGVMSNNIQELQIIKNLGVGCKQKKPPDIKTCYWLLPQIGEMKANCDGSSRGNPGRAGCGVVFRDHNAAIQGLMVKSLGVTTSFMAECTAIITEAEKAFLKGWYRLLITTDSQAAVTAFKGNSKPWHSKPKWQY
ncbi:hypothetical protein GIB67_032180 [Kingdonia uniflora]|uniref:RNase H type-1 domain-containing protein n=1 Tax=Kingdonia uniflora TaxID=39325 RepID=A0A7J7MWT7_9MAGN|nr:hypothetical protein GIB67_032180 [Kingdonia uniflora]